MDALGKLTSLLIKGNFPPVKRLFPETVENYAVVNTAELVEATRRVSLVADSLSDEDTLEIVVEEIDFSRICASPVIVFFLFFGRPLSALDFSPLTTGAGGSTLSTLMAGASCGIFFLCPRVSPSFLGT